MTEFLPQQVQKNASPPVQVQFHGGMVLPDTPAVLQRKELSAAIQRRKEAMLDRFIPGGIPSKVPTIQRKSSTLLPLPVQNKMEATMGADFSNVNIHPNSQQAQEVGALAYTQGNDVHFAPGQFDPDSQKGQSLIGHEFAHVVQQRQGRVQATTQAKGMPVNDDPGLEKEADEVGEKAAQMKVGEGTENMNINSIAFGNGSIQMKSGAACDVIQRLASPYGKFIPTISKTSNGVDAKLEFEPDEKMVDATKIVFSQAVRTSIAGKPRVIDPSQKDRMVNDGSGADGFRIDRLTTQNNPLYGTPSLGAGKGIEDTSGTNSKYDLGYRYDDKGVSKKKTAWMHDEPGHAPVNDSKMEFESAALAIEGAQKNTYYGSIKWGWNRDASGVLTEISSVMASQGTPTNNFLAAAQGWNTTTARGTVTTKAADTIAYKNTSGVFSEDFKVAAGTNVERIHSIATAKGEYQKSKILNGPEIGKEPYFHVDDLKDLGDGGATANLPIVDVHVIQSPVELNKDVPGPWRSTSTLPKGTRVRVTDRTYENGPFAPTDPFAWKVMVEVVDGPNVGEGGWIPATVLKDENSKVN